MTAAGADPPPFEIAVARLRAFAAQQDDVVARLLFFSVEQVLLLRETIYLTVDALAPLASVRQQYDDAVARGFGVSLNVVGRSEDALFAYVASPADAEDATDRQQWDPLKLSIGQPLRRVVTVGRRMMWLLRRLGGSRAAARTRDTFD